MIVVKLVRVTAGDDSQGTFGRIYAPGGWSRYTGELPWRENAAGVSCVPEGRFECRWAYSPRLRRFTYRLLNVPARGGILIHSANFVGDEALGFKCQLQGCIVLGERLGVMDGQRAVLLSRPAVREFETLLSRQPFTLEVIYA